MHVRQWLTAGGFSLVALLVADRAEAHAFGARYDLPLPLTYYLIGAGAAVAFSFLVMAVFFRRVLETGARPGVAQSGGLSESAPVSVVVAIARACSLFVFALVIVTGFFGTQATIKNFAPTMVWVIWWVGFAFVAALVGDLWKLVNPWSVVFDWTGAARRRIRSAWRARESLAYPAWLGAWPAFVLFVVFAWLELVSGAGEQPRKLAFLILAYSAVTWTGMWAFGRRAWLENGETFSIVFGLFARFAPLRVEEPSDDRPRRFRLRPYAAGLLEDRPRHVSLVALVLTVLATVSFDGFVETPAWMAIVQGLLESEAARPALLAIRDAGIDLGSAIKTGGLFAAPALFGLAYFLFCLAIRALADAAGGREVGVGEVAGTFAFSLVPIAIAYHLAHYYSFLLLAGQLIVPLISDPFGFGWNLFGTTVYRMDISVVDAKTVWYLAVGAIVIGHVVAVVVAHIAAYRLYRDAKIAVVSQLPMLVLMVAYTMSSLWILSQPVVAE